MDLITIATFVFPLIRLESFAIASRGPAIAKGFVVGLVSALVARLYARAQYRVVDQEERGAGVRADVDLEIVFDGIEVHGHDLSR